MRRASCLPGWCLNPDILAGMLTEHPLVNAVIFAFLGIAVFAVAYAILLKLTPLNLWRELTGERNVAVAIFAGAAAIGICLIIAAAMH
jgi:putative membrane protein